MLDGQGNVVAVTDQGGNMVDSYRYDQWGRPTSVQEAVPQQLRYAGYWYDGELGWYWLSVRSYDPALCRFLQPDPSEQEGLFSYVYANDNPVDQADPSGLAAAPPPQFGCIVTGDGHFDCDEAVGSPPWNSDLGEAGNIGVVKTQGGFQVIFPMHPTQGCNGFGPGPIDWLSSGVCKLGMGLLRLAQNLVGVSCTINSNNLQLLNPLGGLENWVGAHLVCPDLKTLVGLQQGNKALAAFMLALSVVPAGRVGSVLERFGIQLPELAAKYGRRPGRAGAGIGGDRRWAEADFAGRMREWILASIEGSRRFLAPSLPLRWRILPDQHPDASWKVVSQRLQVPRQCSVPHRRIIPAPLPLRA